MENIWSKEKLNTYLHRTELSLVWTTNNIWRIQRWRISETSDITGSEDTIEVEIELMDATEDRVMLRLETSDAEQWETLQLHVTISARCEISHSHSYLTRWRECLTWNWRSWRLQIWINFIHVSRRMGTRIKCVTNWLHRRKSMNIGSNDWHVLKKE